MKPEGEKTQNDLWKFLSKRCTVLDLTQYYPNIKLTDKNLVCICTHFHSFLNFGVWLPGYFDLFSKRKIKLKFGSVRTVIRHTET